VIVMAQAWRCIYRSIAAGAFWMCAMTTPVQGDTGQLVAQSGPASAYRPQAAAPIDAQAVSCKDLKDKLQSAGTLDIASGQRAWGETFHGPGVPQCEFWQRPQFMYVSASDGSCGVGYVCAQRVTGGI